MTDFKDIILAVLAILIPAIVAILGYVIHRKTERIKIMESQLSDKKIPCICRACRYVF